MLEYNEEMILFKRLEAFEKGFYIYTFGYKKALLNHFFYKFRNKEEKNRKLLLAGLIWLNKSYISELRSFDLFGEISNCSRGFDLIF